MKIIGLLSWYDESPHWLGATIASCHDLVDQWVCVDGAYDLFPRGFTPAGDSGAEQHEAIRLATQAAGADLLVATHEGPWPGEVEKRTAMFRLAAAVAEPGDWLLVIDADEVVLEWAPDLRKRLADADELVAKAGLVQTTWGESGTFDHDHGRQVVHVKPMRMFFRALPNMRVEGAHHFYAADVDGETVWLWGTPNIVPLEPALDLTHSILVEHRNHLRPARRAHAAQSYYAARERAGAEAPPPVPIPAET